MTTLLDPEEYVEQAYFFRVLRERLPKNRPLQELLQEVREELLASAKLPMAVDYMLSELRHSGTMAPAMASLHHYFVPFQTYLVAAAEEESGRFDMRLAVELLCAEAQYRAESVTPAGLFMFQFESLCRNRLRYDRGLQAVSEDPLYSSEWSQWILTVRRQIGIVDVADLVYFRSQYYRQRAGERGLRLSDDEAATPALFGPKEGRIALANRGKEPLLLFAALQRHLGYPRVPRPQPVTDPQETTARLMRRVERLETRVKMLEDEQRQQGIDLTKFYGPGDGAG